jgi:VanZ family protein
MMPFSHLTNQTKLLVTILFAIISVMGFMVKLPAVFHHMDKELHTMFYFVTACFLNLLFANTKLYRHILIFLILLLFGISIEYAQEYSNLFFHKRIHGRFDKEDVYANAKGLIAFSIIWVLYLLIEIKRNTKSNT